MKSRLTASPPAKYWDLSFIIFLYYRRFKQKLNDDDYNKIPRLIQVLDRIYNSFTDANMKLYETLEMKRKTDE